MSHPSRYDITYLAAAFNRLAELSEQQQHGVEEVAGEGGDVGAAKQQQKLLKVLLGRLRQLQSDATPSELAAVLTAAVKLGVQDARFFAAAAASAVSGDNLDAATDDYIAAVMYAVAVYGSSGSSSRADSANFSSQQQHRVLKKCLAKLVQLVQRQQRQQQQQSAPLLSVGAAAAAAIAGTEAAPVAAANAAVVQPSAVITALWAAASAGLPRQLRLSTVFNYLCDPLVVQQLAGSTTTSNVRQQQQQQPQPEEAGRNCGTVLWAAAQLGFTNSLDMLKPYMSAFLQAMGESHVPCSSILTVALSLAMLLDDHHRQQQQQPQQAYAGGPHVIDETFWRSCFQQCSEAVLSSLQQDQAPAAAAAVASQLLWAYEVVGLKPSQEQLQTLLQLTKDQVSIHQWLV